MSTKTQLLPIDDIRIDGGTQPRAEIDQGIVEEYAEAYKANDPLPPLVVYFDGANYWLADGFHRWHAARKADLVKIECDIRNGTQRDAVLFSVGANATHGHRRTNADKRKAVATLLNDREWSCWSNNEIAKRCFVSHTFVNSIRSELEGVSSERTYKTRHGSTTTMNTENIGRGRNDEGEEATARDADAHVYDPWPEERQSRSQDESDAEDDAPGMPEEADIRLADEPAEPNGFPAFKAAVLTVLRRFDVSNAILASWLESLAEIVRGGDEAS